MVCQNRKRLHQSSIRPLLLFGKGKRQPGEHLPAGHILFRDPPRMVSDHLGQGLLSPYRPRLFTLGLYLPKEKIHHSAAPAPTGTGAAYFKTSIRKGVTRERADLPAE